jgi:hypothetical protein
MQSAARTWRACLIAPDFACCSSSPSSSEPAASSSPRVADPEELAAVVARLRQALPSMQVRRGAATPQHTLSIAWHHMSIT